MPEINTELKRVFDELRTTHEAFKEHADKTADELRKNSEVSALSQEALSKVDAAVAELKTNYDEIRKEMQRPAAGTATTGIESEEESPELRSAFEKYIRYGVGESGRAMMKPEEIRALTSASDADGGFLVNPSFEASIISNAYDEAELRPICQVGSTGRDVVIIPAMSKATVAWGTVNVSPTAQDLNAGNERIAINDLKALVRIHNNTLDDSEADVMGELNTMFSMAVAEAEDDAIAVGVGVNSPQGVAAWADVQARYSPSGVAAALSDATNNGVDAIIGALYGLKKVYRRNATWALNSTTEGVTRKLKDGDGQYLWQPPVQAGAPALLVGRPLVNPEGMPDIAANAFPIVIGDFMKGYKLRDRAGVVVQRLVEKYAEYDQTGFLLKRRVGGQPVLAEAFYTVKIAAS